MYDLSTLCGVIPPLFTQFTERDEVDHRAIERHVEFLVEKGVDGLFVCGTSGEFITLSVEERCYLSQCVAQVVNHRIPLIVHVTAPSLRDTLRLASHAEALGVEGIAVMPPWYYKYNESDIIAWLGSIAETFPDIALVVYNIPQCNGYDVHPATVRALKERYPNIVGIKNSQEDAERVVTYSEWSGFNFLVGSDHLYLYTLMHGGRGSVAALANILPEPYVRLRDAYQRGDWIEALQIQAEIDHYSRMLHGSELSYLKAGLEQRGLGTRRCRAPQRTLDNVTLQQWVKVWRSVTDNL